MSRTTKALALSAVAAAAVAAGAGVATADAGAHGTAANSPGVVSGNVIQVPVHVPVNVCGNTVDVIGVLNPTFGVSGRRRHTSRCPEWRPPRKRPTNRHLPSRTCADVPSPGSRPAPAGVVRLRPARAASTVITRSDAAPKGTPPCALCPPGVSRPPRCARRCSSARPAPPSPSPTTTPPATRPGTRTVRPPRPRRRCWPRPSSSATPPGSSPPRRICSPRCSRPRATSSPPRRSRSTGRPCGGRSTPRAPRHRARVPGRPRRPAAPDVPAAPDPDARAARGDRRPRHQGTGRPQGERPDRAPPGGRQAAQGRRGG